MRKNKLILGAAVIVCGLVLTIGLTSYENGDGDGENTQADDKRLVTVQQAIESYEASIKQADYDNLIFHEFNGSIEGVEDVYNIKPLENKEDLGETFLEGFELMDKAVDDFFQEEFDKSYLEVIFYMPEGIDDERIPYNDVRATCSDEKYDGANVTVLFGNNTKSGGRMIQIARGGAMAWFSRGGFGTISPWGCEHKEIYRYISGIRQSEDVLINLKDGAIKLSEMEKNALSYISESYPWEVNEEISFAIGDARVIDLGDYDGIYFGIRRVYKGIPFEFGYESTMSLYNDEYVHDSGEIDYVESFRPDTLSGLSCVELAVEETETITEMIPLDKALDMLSDKIGDNSIYDVYGVELIYREQYTRDQQYEMEEKNIDISGILKPVWKIITMNQNDDKYTIFYIDVVTGDITERFEYYYE